MHAHGLGFTEEYWEGELVYSLMGVQLLCHMAIHTWLCLGSALMALM